MPCTVPLTVNCEVAIRVKNSLEWDEKPENETTTTQKLKYALYKMIPHANIYEIKRKYKRIMIIIHHHMLTKVSKRKSLSFV